MHRYVIRLRNDVFNLLKTEAESRNISINDFMTYCIEVALAEYMNESAEAFKDSIKDKAIQKERNRLKNEQESWETVSYLDSKFIAIGKYLYNKSSSSSIYIILFFPSFLRKNTPPAPLILLPVSYSIKSDSLYSLHISFKSYSYSIYSCSFSKFLIISSKYNIFIHLYIIIPHFIAYLI